MKSEREIRERLERIKSQDALKRPRADPEDNPELARMQSDLEVQIKALEWVLEDE